MYKRALLAVALVTAAVPLAACGPNGSAITGTVTITYHKAGGCAIFDDTPVAAPDTVQTAGDDGLFVVYVVDSIANTAGGAKDFAFDPSLFYVSTGSTPAMFPFDKYFTLKPQTVKAGSTATQPGWTALLVGGVPSEVQSNTDHLQYHSPSGVSVVLANQNDNNALINGGTCTPTTVP